MIINEFENYTINDALTDSVYHGDDIVVKILIEEGAFLTEPAWFPDELQDRVIENSLSSLNFITNLRPDLKEKYSELLALASLGL